MTEFQTILQAATQLSVEDRLRLIDELAATVPEDQPATLSTEWLLEIQRRSAEMIAEMIAGTEVGTPWEEVRERVFGTLRTSSAN